MNDLITVIGTAGSKPELTTTPKGHTVTSFRLASNLRRYDAAAGRWSDVGTNWYSVSAWGELAEHVAESIGSGDPVIVHGRLRIRSWGEGERRGTSIDLDAEAVGHSLRFGTTRFQKAERAGAAPHAVLSGGSDTFSADVAETPF